MSDDTHTPEFRAAEALLGGHLPSYAECHDALVAALRNYITYADMMRFNLLSESRITLQEAKDDVAEMQPFSIMLALLEQCDLPALGTLRVVL